MAFPMARTVQTQQQQQTQQQLAAAALGLNRGSF
jgi:hypothetical protein